MLPGVVEERLWARCGSAGCRAARLEPDGVCLAHLPPDQLVAQLNRYRRGRALDARGVRLGPELWGEILAATPVDGQGRLLPSKGRFDGAVFEADVVLDGARFVQDASFQGARFEGTVSFQHVTMLRQARFSQAVFAAPARFDGARIDGAAWFAAAQFEREVSFSGVSFGGPSWFSGTLFGADVFFRDAAFAHETTFEEADFGCHSAFDGAAFEGDARFGQTQFAKVPMFVGTVFQGPSGVPAVPGQRRAPWFGPPLAGLHRRTAAALVDVALVAAVLLGTFTVAAFSRWIQQGTIAALAVIAGCLSALWFASWNLVTQGRTGQTVGKRWLRLRLLGEQSRRPVGAHRSLLRAGFHVLDTLPLMLGWLWPLWDDKRQTFADKLAATVVIKVPENWRRANAEDPDGELRSSGFGCRC